MSHTNNLLLCRSESEALTQLNQSNASANVTLNSIGVQLRHQY